MHNGQAIGTWDEWDVDAIRNYELLEARVDFDNDRTVIIEA